MAGNSVVPKSVPKGDLKMQERRKSQSGTAMRGGQGVTGYTGGAYGEWAARSGKPVAGPYGKGASAAKALKAGGKAFASSLSKAKKPVTKKPVMEQKPVAKKASPASGTAKSGTKSNPMSVSQAQSMKPGNYGNTTVTMGNKNYTGVTVNRTTNSRTGQTTTSVGNWTSAPAKKK